MRHFALWSGLLLLPLLTACGNGNDGRGFTPYKKTSSSAVSSTISSTSGTANLTKLLYCRDPLMVSSDASFNSYFAGSVLCPSEGQISGTKGFSVRLKVNANFPVNARLCVIPFVYDSADTEVCFAINGQQDVLLSTDRYNSIVVVAEANLNAYKSFMVNPAALAPPRVIFSL